MLEFGSLGSGGAVGGSAGGAGGPWEEILDRDWLPDNEVRFLLPPTQQTRYQTKVFQQSVTILIKLQPNTTRGTAAVSGRGVGVGPWRVSEEQLPVLVGSITGASLLLLLLLSLLLYAVCHHHRPTHKNYSVKSEVSSVTSGRTQGSPPSLSRESLVVVTHAISGPQACLLGERDPSLLDLTYECGCCCDPPCDMTSCTCECQDQVGDEEDDEDEDEEEEEEEDDEEEEDEELGDEEEEEEEVEVEEQRRDSLSRRESRSPREAGQVTPGNSRVKPGYNTASSSSSSSTFMNFDLTLPRRPRRGSTGRRDSCSGGGGGRQQQEVGVGLPVCPEARLDEQSASSSALESVCPGREGGLASPTLDDNFRTRSLPAWVRGKTRPLAALDDLTPIYEKPHWSKRRRNRMRSDAAAIIALTKSRGRLMSPAHPAPRPHSLAGPATAPAAPPGVTPGSGAAGAGTATAPQPADTAALVENEAVVVYDERTAL
ncbi:histone H3.v1-like [Eriocheir sinensis]|uniref:histone H3.v1-like n=1 Tax=Eriocheir sinensis TaxID=95602 RepID=UPI0021C68613|nr:histone H3.v1-like [Eriocheir sinensis]XP_050735986.1 histone H3.v1-like [Eriocheir sinensis]XP_050735988.1 histone H3.v1-like [Eriocheir sinensis]XP_050735989.1 histone H3.v1-like [Eriocheir sinensis]